MVDRELVRRATARYTVGYAGGAAALAVVAFRSELVMLLFVLAGLGAIVLAFATETGSPSRRGEAIDGGLTYVHSGGADDGVPSVKYAAGDVKALFLGVGLVAFGLVGMVVVSVL